MRKKLSYFALFAIAIGFFSPLQGNETGSLLLCASCQEENTSLQEELEVQPEKIYIEPEEVSILDGQILAYLNGQWETVAGLSADAQGLYVVMRGYHPDCPPNFQWPVCPNHHKAVYEVFTPKGEHYRYLCNYCDCDYEYHNYVRKFLPPGYYLTGIKNRN